MKRWLKRMAFTLLAVILLLAGAGLWFWNAHLPSYDLALNRAFLKLALQSPEMLTQIHMLEQFGIKFHQDELDDASPEAGDRSLEQMRAIMADLRDYDRETLSEQERISYDIASWMMDAMEEGSTRWRWHNYPVNQLFGVQNNFPSFMESAHAIETVGDAEDYNTRLSRVGWKFDGVLQGLKIREEKGILPPTFVVDKVLEEMEKFTAQPVEENILFRSMAEKLEKAGITGETAEQLKAETARQILASVYPAYARLIDYFKAIRPKTTTDAGVWKLPDGDAFYRFSLKMMTTTDLEPEEIHQIGLNEVARIEAEMRAILQREGYDTTQPIGQIMQQLGQEPRFLYTDDDEGRKQILADYQAIIDEISAGLSPMFAVMPKAGVEVKRVPAFKEKTAPGAYYNPPAMDGSRPGIFYANLYDIKATPRYSMRTLAYHEAVPGHHFQIAIAQEQKDLPFFRRMLPMPAFAEGWALYAERLAWEAGFEKNPYENLGRLQAELFRAVRLVVDTGIHAKRWTREQAIDYMLEHAGMAESDVIAEVERYIVMPGQACAYKIGMLKILELRKRAREALGDGFDIRAFHDVLLKNGAMPLDILEKIVDQWIASQKEAAEAA